MKISVRNYTSDPKSKEDIAKVKFFTLSCIKELKLQNIKNVKITYRDFYHRYYIKGRPLVGFKKLYSNQTIAVHLYENWNKDLYSNCVAIAHELIHVKQLQKRTIQISKDDKNIKFNNKTHHDWKKFRFSDFESIKDSVEKEKYLHKYLPWEKEVTYGVSKLINKFFVV